MSFVVHRPARCLSPMPGRLMPRPIMLGIVGDSGSGKTTITRGLVRVSATSRSRTSARTTITASTGAARRAEHDAAASGMQLHRRPRRSTSATCARTRRCSSPSIATRTGPSAPPVYLHAGAVRRRRGAARVSSPGAAQMFDVRVYLDPPEELRRRWKVAARLLSSRLHNRPGARRSSTCASRTRRRSSARSATMPTSSSRFRRRCVGRPGQARRAPLSPRDAAAPRLAEVIARGTADGVTLTERDGRARARRPRLDAGGACAELEEAIWERMHFASHLREQRLGEFIDRATSCIARRARADAAPDPVPRRHGAGGRRARRQERACARRSGRERRLRRRATPPRRLIHRLDSRRAKGVELPHAP